MKTNKLITTLLAALIILAVLAGCNTQTPTGQESTQPAQTDIQETSVPSASTTPSETENTAETSTDATTEATAETTTIMFTDSAGREVELPRNIERIIPSGPLAQIVLYTLVPDKLVGLATEFTNSQLTLTDPRFATLPVTGNASAGTLNLESVLLATPQIVIDIGQPSSSVAESMEDIQNRTGIPSVFIHLEDFETMISGYRTLGEILGAEDQAGRLIDYINENIIGLAEIVSAIPESEKKTLYYGQDDGLTAFIAGTIHTEVIEYIGAINIADLEQTIRNGGAEVSMEQLMLWDPDVFIFAPGSIFDTVSSQAEWMGLTAIREGRYYEVPLGLYNWMGRPPSVNRLLGVRWLANLIYPSIYRFDMIQETRDFYKLFYHCDLTDEQVLDMLAKSTLKIQTN